MPPNHQSNDYVTPSSFVILILMVPFPVFFTTCSEVLPVLMVLLSRSMVLIFLTASSFPCSCAFSSPEGGDYYENEAYLPRTGNPKDEIFHDNETLRAKLSELWIKVKAAK